MHWLVPLSVVAAALSVGAGAWGLTRAEADDCAKGMSPVPYDGSTTADGRVILHFRHTGKTISYTVCFIQDSTLRDRTAFRLSDGERRTLDVRLPADVVTYVVESDAGWLAGGGAGRSTLDLRSCPDKTHEFEEESEATWNSWSSAGHSVRCVGMQHSGATGGHGYASASNRQQMSSGEAAVPADAGDGPLRPGGAQTLLGVGTAVSVGFAAWKLVPGVRGLGWLLFTRLRQPEILRQQTRNQIYEAIRQDPGVHAKALADRLELGGGQVDYHLGVLVRSGLVSRLARSGHRSYFVQGAYTRSTMERLAALRLAGAKDAVAILETSPGLTLRELAHRLRIGDSRASKLVKRLRENGIVDARPDGRYLRLRLAAAEPMD